MEAGQPGAFIYIENVHLAKLNSVVCLTVNSLIMDRVLMALESGQ